jgi:hypothetical protein
VAKAIPKKTRNTLDDVESVAKRLGCDPDLKGFDKKLGKLARAKTAPKPTKRTS